MYGFSPHQLRYLAVGGLNTLCGYGLFSLCHIGLRSRLSHSAIFILAHLLAVSFSFATYSRWVYQDIDLNNWKITIHAWMRFQLSYAGLLCVSFPINYLALHYLTTSVWIAQLLALIFNVATGYVLNNKYAFHFPTKNKNSHNP